MIEGQIARDHILGDRGYKGDQIAFYAFHPLLVEVQTKLATYVPSMRNSKLEIKIAGSSCRPQNRKIQVHFYGRSPLENRRFRQISVRITHFLNITRC